MRNLDTSLSRKEEAFSECVKEKNDIQNKNSNLETEISQKNEEIAGLKEDKVSPDSKINSLRGAHSSNHYPLAKYLFQEMNTNNIQTLKKEVEKLTIDNNTLVEELKYLRRRNEELGRNTEECRNNEIKITQLGNTINLYKYIYNKL